MIRQKLRPFALAVAVSLLVPGRANAEQPQSVVVVVVVSPAVPAATQLQAQLETAFHVSRHAQVQSPERAAERGLNLGSVAAGESTTLQSLRAVLGVGMVLHVSVEHFSEDQLSVTIRVVTEKEARSRQVSVGTADSSRLTYAAAASDIDAVAAAKGETKPSAATESRQSTAYDEVRLRNGARYTGTVEEWAPTGKVVILLSGGEARAFAMKDVDRIRLGPRPGETEAIGQLLRRPEHSHGQVGTPKLDPLDGSLRLDATQNCNPGESRCQGQSVLGADTHGLSGSFTREQVLRVKSPPKGAINANVEASLLVGSSTGSGPGTTLVGANANLKLTMVGGTRFPGARGGAWHGILVEPTAGASTAALSGSSVSGQISSWRLGGAIGWQYLHFSRMDKSSLKQPGFGFALGGYAGAEGQTIKVSTPALPGEPESTRETEKTQANYGPLLRLSSLRYNPGTARMTRLDVTLLAVPAGNFFYGMASVSYGF